MQRRECRAQYLITLSRSAFDLAHIEWHYLLSLQRKKELSDERRKAKTDENERDSGLHCWLMMLLFLNMGKRERFINLLLFFSFFGTKLFTY
jgi:hypothetical protein